MSESADDKGSAARRLQRLATERTALFAMGAATVGRTAEAQVRLAAIERELDEAYVALRRQRAERDATRFTNEERRMRSGLARVEATARPRPAK